MVDYQTYIGETNLKQFTEIMEGYFKRNERGRPIRLKPLHTKAIQDKIDKAKAEHIKKIQEAQALHEAMFKHSDAVVVKEGGAEEAYENIKGAIQELRSFIVSNENDMHISHDLSPEDREALIMEIVTNPEIVKELGQDTIAQIIEFTDYQIIEALDGSTEDVDFFKNLISELRSNAKPSDNRKLADEAKQLCTFFPSIKKQGDDYNFERRLQKLGYPQPLPALHTVKKLNYLGGSFEIIFENPEDNEGNESGHGVQQPGHAGSEPYINSRPEPRRRTPRPTAENRAYTGSKGTIGVTVTSGSYSASTQLKSGNSDSTF